VLQLAIVLVCFWLLPRLAIVYMTFIVVLGFVLNEEGRAKVKDIGALECALKNTSH